MCRYATFEINFHLNYEITTSTSTSAETQLRQFTFGFAMGDISSLKELSGQPETDGLVIGEAKKTGWKADISWLTVTVRRSLDQDQLVRNLIRLAVGMRS